MIKFYFDEMMPRPVANQLAQKGIEVVMANDVGMTEKDDLSEHLPYALENKLVLVTNDHPLANKAWSLEHAGVICWTGKQDDIGGMVRALTEFAENHKPEAVKGQVFWLK